MRLLLLISALIVAVGPLSACGNTLEGFGQDVEKAGESIQKL